MAAANTDPFFVLKNMARNLELRVGVLEGATHTDESGRTIPVAEYAIYNEFGATIRVTPQMRAFLHYKGIHLSAETEPHLTNMATTGRRRWRGFSAGGSILKRRSGRSANWLRRI